VRVTEQESTDREAGTVLAQSPSGGSNARVGDTVTLTVAAEPTTATVPTVVGRTQATAEKRLQDAGFAVRVTTETVSDATQDGRVISADPAEGQEVRAGSTVTIVVGKVPTATTTPEATTP
jgi:beta-lactam-binding protein with PASTA domain